MNAPLIPSRRYQAALVAGASGRIGVGCLAATGPFMWGIGGGLAFPPLADVPEIYGIGLVAWGPNLVILWLLATALIAVLHGSRVVRAVKRFHYWAYLVAGTVAGYAGGLAFSLTGHPLII